MAIAGLRIRDPVTGAIISDPTFYWGRVLAVRDIPASSSGSYSIPNPPAEYGTRRFRAHPVDTGFNWASGYSNLAISVSGTTVTYANSNPYAFKVIHTLN